MKKKILMTLAMSLCLLTAMAETPNKLPLKLRVGTYNVGHFNQGKLGGYQGEDVKEELQRWKSWIGSQSLDIFLVNEWNLRFDKDSTYNAEAQLLQPIYNNRYFGKANRWIYNGINTNYILTNIRQVNWFKDYYAIVGDLKIGKKTITVMSTHIPWQKEGHEMAVEAMIKEMKKYEYLICGGDMNALDTMQLRIQKARFNIANGGFNGWFCSAPQNEKKGMTDVHIDNIVTSPNIKIVNVSAPHTGLTEFDHLPVLADLIITW